MVNFEYYAPTKVIFGKGVVSETPQLLKEFGAKKILLHYGSSFALKSGLIDGISSMLKEEGFEFHSLGGVKPNPRLSLVRTGIELCREKDIDFILAVGGGSVIDSAKAIAAGAVYDNDVWDFFDGKAELNNCLPIGCVLTNAAAGSEMSSSCVINNDELGLKRSINSNLVRCRFAVMNPELTMSLPPYQTACGGADILMHTLERYLTPENPMMISDEIAQGLMRSTIEATKNLMRRPESYSARANLMWASSLSHNGLTGCGGGPGDWACHQISHELSAMFDIAHGAALTAVWSSWARYVLKSPKNISLAHTSERFEKLGETVLMIERDDTDGLAAAAIEEMENFFWGIELPVNLEEADIFPTDEQFKEMALKCTKYGGRTIGGLVELNENDIEAILRMAAKPFDEDDI